MMGAAASCAAANMFECATCVACSCFASFLNWTMAQATRFAHLTILVLCFVFAVIVGKVYPDKINGYNYYTQIDLTAGCNSSYDDECIYRQLIYRSSFTLALFFVVMAILSFLSDAANKRFWLLKLGCVFSVFIGFWWGENDFFSGWAEAARAISFLWILVQGLLILDFAHDLHDIIMLRADAVDSNGEDSRSWYVLYLVLSGGFLTAAIVGLVYLFQSYTGCSLGMFFVVLTLVMGVLTTIISLLNIVNGGLLTPCIMFAYSVFMCWYALLSSPDSSCNPTSDENNGSKDIALIVTVIVSSVILLYCVINGSKILNIFNPEGEGVMKSYTQGSSSGDLHTNIGGTSSINMSRDGNASDMEARPATSAENGTNTTQLDVFADQDSGTTVERMFYHIFMILVSCYGAMVLTSWGSTDGTPENQDKASITSGKESMWLKIVSQWLFLIMYCRALQVTYENNRSS